MYYTPKRPVPQEGGGGGKALPAESAEKLYKREEK
jgi:hypothetical protein